MLSVCRKFIAWIIYFILGNYAIHPFSFTIHDDDTLLAALWKMVIGSVLDPLLAFLSFTCVLLLPSPIIYFIKIALHSL